MPFAGTTTVSSVGGGKWCSAGSSPIVSPIRASARHHSFAICPASACLALTSAPRSKTRIAVTFPNGSRSRMRTVPARTDM